MVQLDHVVPNTIKKFHREITQESQDLFKTLNLFLVELPEYVHLERALASKVKTMSDIVNFEIANDVFIAVEREMDVLEEINCAKHDDQPFKIAVERKPGLRNKTFGFKSEYGKSSSSGKRNRDSGTVSYAFVKTLHSIIFKAGHKCGMLIPLIEKFRKFGMNNNLVPPIIKLDFPILTHTKCQLKKLKIDFAPTQGLRSIYIELAKFVHVCYAFHRGVEVF
jgi:hypothetical protein